ncbi:MAG: class I SAM-dependent methyltransferase [Pirellulaceae bacterium]
MSVDRNVISMPSNVREQEKRQEHLYDRFPYHYIAHFESSGTPSLIRRLEWGLKYLAVLEHVKAEVVAREPGSLLDVGCGDARLIHEMKDTIASCCGVDVSERALAYARAFNPEAHCTFALKRVQDVHEQFELVTCIDVLEHIPDEEECSFLSACWRCVAPGGTLIVCVPSSNVPLNPKHFRHYSSVDLCERITKAEVDADSCETRHLIHVQRNRRMERLANWGIFMVNARFRRWLWRLYKASVLGVSPNNAHKIIWIGEKAVCQ